MEEHGSADPEDAEGHGHARERPSRGTCMTPYPSEPEAGRGSRAVTLALLAVALVVALGAGGTVYAVLDDDGPGAQPTAPSAAP